MNAFPKDIFTEPAHVDPNTLDNLGPLRRLAGTWQAQKGVDVNPKAAGPERRVYIERIDLQPIDPQTNGPQLFYVCSTAFLEYAFVTDRYRIEIDYHADGSWSYAIETVLSVRGQAAPFVHRDQNTLFKIEEPQPNPLARIVAARPATT